MITKQANTAFYEAVLRQSGREWAVVRKVEGAPLVIASYNDMEAAITVTAQLNAGGAEAFVVFTPQDGQP